MLSLLREREKRGLESAAVFFPWLLQLSFYHRDCIRRSLSPLPLPSLYASSLRCTLVSKDCAPEMHLQIAVPFAP